MVTKGIITSIDFNGNTCQVRIPLFETAGNDPITGTAIVSNTPGSYNGYKVGDVVLVAFEDGKMQNPVIVGKLYLGAAKEKQDPRGTINVETTTASKSASLPADAVLTANVDSNVPNTNTPFGSLASIANNLNSLNTDVNQLDRFTRNQFNSVITDVNKQGEQLRSEIKQTANNIEANVVHKHQDGSQNALGWDLNEKSWTINAKDTVNETVKDINIVTIDRSGMTLSGDLKLNGYPKNITVLYVRIDPNAELPQLYKFTPVDFPETSPENPIDNAWYYGKYIQITEAETGKEKYVLILKENFEYYNKLEQLKPGETIAYNREIASDWSTTVPERVDGQYIWQWTHTEIYSFDKDNNIWNEKDDDKVVCITGADGKDGQDGAPGAAGYNTATVLLYKRKTKSESAPTINWTNDLTYTFATHSLSSVPSGWSTTIPAPVANDGGLYVTVAIAYSNTGTDTIPPTEWTIPSLYVENGEDGNDSTSYWLKLSSPIHLGVNQKSDITISPMSQTGTEGEKQDTAFIRYYFEGETTPNWPSSASTLITIPKEDLINKNLVVEATHSASGTPYANETITYSSLTSPTMDLSRDSGAINYDSDGMTKTGSDISSTATAYLGETEYSGATSFSWTLSPNGYASSDYEISGDKKTITIKNCWADTVSATCTAICTGRSGTVLVPTLKPLYKKEKYKVDSGVKKVLVEGADKPYWEWTAGGATQKVALTNTEIKQQYITLEKTFTVTKQIKGDQGEGGVSVATVQLFKRSSNAITTKPVSTDSNYWTYYFTGANAGKAVLTGTDSIWGDCSSSIPAGSDPVYETHTAVITMPGEISAKIINWSTPAKFVENGAAGVSIIQNKQWYILWPADNKNGPGKPDAANKLDKPDATPTTLRMWIPIPPEAVNDYVVWTCYESIFSDGHSEYSDPVKDNAYALAQGKTTNYYSPTEPTNNIKEGDCWFDTGYVKLATNPDTKTGYLGKFVLHSDQDQNIKVDDKDKIYVEGINPDTSGAFTRFIPSKSESSQLYMVKINPDNIDDENLFTVKTEDTAGTDTYETGNLKQCSGFNKDTKKAIWEDIAGELVTNKLTANYINALDITTKKITVLQDAAAAIEEQKILFEADGTNATGKVKIADFDVNHESLHSFSDKNGYELNIKSANDVELDKQITIDASYMKKYDISMPLQRTWEELKKWPTNGQSSGDGPYINDDSITKNYTLLQLNTPVTGTSDTDPDSNIWLTPQGYISALRIDILQDILDFNAWIGIINSAGRLNRTDYLSSQDTVRFFSSTTKFTKWKEDDPDPEGSDDPPIPLAPQLKNFKDGKTSLLSELGYCRPAIGDETSKMPTSGSLTDNLVKFSWGNLSAGTYLYCVVENNYPRDYVISNSSGQDQTIEYEDIYGNIHTTIIPGGEGSQNVPGYLRAFLVLDGTFTKYGAAISAGYNGEDFVLTGDGKVIASNILITGGSITADSGNIGPLELSAGEINTAGLMINKSSTHIKNGASLKILGKSGNTTKPIAKLSKNGFVISSQGMQAENNKYFSYKIGEVNGANDAKNTPGLLWKQRSDITYNTVYVKATLNSNKKSITFDLYSDDARTTPYEMSSIPDNKTLDVVVYLKYAVKVLQKRKISRNILVKDPVTGNDVLTNFIPLPEKTIIAVSPIQYKFKKSIKTEDNPNPNSQEVSFASLGVISAIYGISNTKGGAIKDKLDFTMLAPTDSNALDPNLYATSSILPASTFTSEKDKTTGENKIVESKNEYDLGSSTYPWNNVYSKYFYGVSDRREKTDITPLSEQNNLDEFYSKLKPVSFSFKSSNDTLHFGLIAQDVDEASAGLPTDKPLAIVNKSDPNCLSIDYQELIAVNILKIQQLSKKIDSLEAEIKCLKGED